MLGYWDDPERTAEAIDRAGWMHTGDLATMDDEGYLNIVGRSKDMVIRGGENIYPREIEEFLYTHPAIADVQVIGVPDERVRRGAVRVDHRAPGRFARRRRRARLLPQAPRALQGAALRDLRRRVPDDGHRQGPEVQDARGVHRPAGAPGRGGGAQRVGTPDGRPALRTREDHLSSAWIIVALAIGRIRQRRRPANPGAPPRPWVAPTGLTSRVAPGLGGRWGEPPTPNPPGRRGGGPSPLPSPAVWADLPRRPLRAPPGGPLRPAPVAPPQESGAGPDFPARPSHFGPELGGPSEASACAPGAHFSDHWFGFSDGGRHFHVLVAFGPQASAEVQRQAWAILDGLRVDPGVAPDWQSSG